MIPLNLFHFSNNFRISDYNIILEFNVSTIVDQAGITTYTGLSPSSYSKFTLRGNTLYIAALNLTNFNINGNNFTKIWLSGDLFTTIDYNLTTNSSVIKEIYLPDTVNIIGNVFGTNKNIEKIYAPKVVDVPESNTSFLDSIAQLPKAVDIDLRRFKFPVSYNSTIGFYFTSWGSGGILKFDIWNKTSNNGKILDHLKIALVEKAMRLQFYDNGNYVEEYKFQPNIKIKGLALPNLTSAREFVTTKANQLYLNLAYTDGDSSYINVVTDFVLQSRIKPINLIFGNNTEITEIEDLTNTLDGNQIFGNGAFLNCTNLLVFNFPKLNTVTANMFNNTNIETLSLPNLVSINAIRVFSNNRNLKTVDLPLLSNVTVGSIETFYNCALLTDFNAPLLNSLGNYFFGECKSLTTLTLDNVTSSGGRIFNNCTSLEYISLKRLQLFGTDNNILGNIFTGIKKDGEAHFNISLYKGTDSDLYPDISYLYRNRRWKIKFYNNDGTFNKEIIETTNVEMRGNLISFPTAQSFEDKTGITEFTNWTKTQSSIKFRLYDSYNLRLGSFENNLELTGFFDYDGKLVGSLSYYARTFSGCINLTEVMLPNIEHAGASFLNGTSLTTLSLPKLRSVANSSLAYMPYCTTMDLPMLDNVQDTVLSLSNNPLLTNVNAPNINLINDQFYSNNYSLLRAIHPKATEVRNRAFVECRSIQEIDIRKAVVIGSNNSTSNNVFYNIKMGCIIHAHVSQQTIAGGDMNGNLVYAKNTRNAIINFYDDENNLITTI